MNLFRLRNDNSTNHKFNKRGVLLVALALGCFALPPMAQAQLPSPPPDGGYLNGNTAEGDGALFSLTTGSNNTAMGFDALHSSTTGGDSTAVGWQALYNDQVGFYNTAVGSQALFNYNDTDLADPFGGRNTAIGYQALYSDTVGGRNTATGFRALYNDRGGGGLTNGHFNTATGDSALYNNTSGVGNTAVGDEALFNNTSGGGNIALGSEAGDNLTTGVSNIDIGNEGVADESNTIRIGKQGTQTSTHIAGIHGTALGSGVAVRVNANGRLGTAPSSARFKQNIRPMDEASEAVLALRPVTFRYKQELDPEGIPQFGLVAEDVAKVNPDLVTRDAKGKLYTVRYEAVNAMLLNEFLKEHRKVEAQEATITQLRQDFQSKLAEQQKEIKALTVGLQKVSAQLEVNKPVPQVVNNDQ
jgi:hypothetical protein